MLIGSGANPMMLCTERFVKYLGKRGSVNACTVHVGQNTSRHAALPGSNTDAAITVWSTGVACTVTMIIVELDVHETKDTSKIL